MQSISLLSDVSEHECLCVIEMPLHIYATVLLLLLCVAASGLKFKGHIPVKALRDYQSQSDPKSINFNANANPKHELQLSRFPSTQFEEPLVRLDASTAVCDANSRVAKRTMCKRSVCVCTLLNCSDLDLF